LQQGKARGIAMEFLRGEVQHAFAMSRKVEDAVLVGYGGDVFGEALDKPHRRVGEPLVGEGMSGLVDEGAGIKVAGLAPALAAENETQGGKGNEHDPLLNEVDSGRLGAASGRVVVGIAG